MSVDKYRITVEGEPYAVANGLRVGMDVELCGTDDDHFSCIGTITAIKRVLPARLKLASFDIDDNLNHVVSDAK